MRRVNAAVAASVSIFLAACGGGGSGSPQLPPPPAPTPVPENLSVAPLVSADIGEPTAFDNSASTQKGLKFSWDFGDGQSSTEPTPKHSYAKPGDYAVTLKVSNDAGQTREAKSVVSVNNLTAVRGLDCTGAKGSGWCWQAPQPTGNRITSTWFVDNQTGWRVGYYGEIFKTSDGGVTWVRQPSGVTMDLLSVQFADKDVGWVLGRSGALLNTRDGGASWRTVQPGPRAAENADALYMEVRSADVVELFTNGTSWILNTKDGGKTWSEVNSPASMVRPARAPDGSYWAFSGSLLQKADVSGGNPKTVLDLGTQFSSGDGRDVFFAGDATVIVYAGRTEFVSETRRYETTYVLWRSTDAGVTWTKQNTTLMQTEGQAPFDLWTVDPTGQNMLGILGGRPVRSTDFGANWSEFTGLPFPWTSIDDWMATARGRLVVWGKRADTMYVSGDLGKSWQAWAVPQGATNVGARWWPSFVDARTMLLTLASGKVYLLSDEGRSSKVIMEGKAGEGRTHSVAFFDSKRGFMLTNDGELRASVDGGKSWSVKRSDLGRISGRGEERLQVVSDKIAYLLGAEGRIYRSNDAGDTWTNSLAGPYSWTRFAFTDGNNGWASGQINMTGTESYYLTRDAGTTWTKLSALPGQATALYVDAGKTITAVGRAGFVAQSDDEGKTWQMRYSGVSADLSKLYSRDGKQIWALTDAATGYVLRSDDGGQSWAKMLVPSPSALKDIRFLDSQNGWIVGDAGTVLFTKDGGSNWQSQKSGTARSLLRVQFTDLRTGWIVGENGSLLATGTGGN